MSRSDEDGRAVVRATLEFPAQGDKRPRTVIVVTFDPAVNHLVRRVAYTTHFSPKSLVREEWVEEFREAGRGLYFPVRSAHRSGMGGRSNLTFQAIFEDVSVNKALPADAFALRFPANLELTDTVRGVSYKVDAAGRAAGPETPLVTSPPPPPALADLAPDERKESSAEAKSWSGWLLPLSAGLLGIAIAFIAGCALRRAYLTWSV